MSSMKTAVVGCGYWGKNLVRNFHALDALAMVCDETQTGRATAHTLAPKIPVVASLDEVLANKEITALVFATPAETHYALARQALQSGKDVFVEKPLCLSDAEGRVLQTIADESGRILMVGHLLQYHPCVEAIQKMVTSGQLGRLYTIASNRLNLGKIRQEENALWSFAPHDFSVILSLTGNRLPHSISCTGTAHLQAGVCDTTLTVMQFPAGIQAHIYVSWLNPFKEQKLTVVGSSGMVVFDDTLPWKEKLIHYPDYLTWSNGTVPVPRKSAGSAVDLPEEEPLRKECAHFLDCCRTRSRPKTDAAEGLRVLQALNLAQRSLDQGGIPVVSSQEADGRQQEPGGNHAPSPSTPSGAVPLTSDRHPLPPDYAVHPTACVDEGAQIGKGTKIWHFSHVMKGARIGRRCILGQNVNVDGGVCIGDNVKIQNNVSVYTGAEIEDDVFLGPSCVLTNVTNPRSQIVRHSLYEKTRIRRGATIGANATIVCGLTIGRYAFIGAGAVVSRDVPDYALVMGNPAKQHGWMSRHGHRLPDPDSDGISRCPESGFRYRESPPGTLRCLDIEEEAPLPQHLATGQKTYDQLKIRQT